jgi:RNA polymerase sigma factor (TIGR02999 family)
MDRPPQHEVTRLLSQWKEGDQAALDALMPLIESELRRLARGYMRGERAGHTLQPTALVNEAWMRMARQNPREYEGRSHFVAIAAQYMRQILVDHARKKNAARRGAGAQPVAIEDAAIFAPERTAELVALDDGLNELARLDERQARIVELHFFGGLTFDEIAGFMNLGRNTVIRDLRMAQVWLKNYMDK